MNKSNIRKWAIALCALASLSFSLTANAGTKTQPGDDHGGLRGGRQPRPVIIGTNAAHTADDSIVISNSRGRGGRGGGGGSGRGGHDDPPGHH